jgi:hypothetical protein
VRDVNKSNKEAIMTEHNFEELARAIIHGEVAYPPLYEASGTIQQTLQQWRSWAKQGGNAPEFLKANHEQYAHTQKHTISLGPEQRRDWQHLNQKDSVAMIPVGEYDQLVAMGVLQEDGYFSHAFISAMLDVLQEAGMIHDRNIAEFGIGSVEFTCDADSPEPMHYVMMTFEMEDIAATMDHHLNVQVAL